MSEREKYLRMSAEEARIIDNELFVVQNRLSRNFLLSADQAKPTKEDENYNKIVTELRVKIGKFLEKQAIDKIAVNEW